MKGRAVEMRASETTLRSFDECEPFAPASVAMWRALVEKELAGSGGVAAGGGAGGVGGVFERKLITHTYEGLLIKPLYVEEDWKEGWGSDGRGVSGAWPYGRGGAALVAGGRWWDVRQERAEAVPGGEEAAGTEVTLNRAILEDLEHGVSSVLLRLDAAGRSGLDADDPHAGALVGADGAMMSTMADWRDAFAGVHLSMMGVALEAGAAFVPAAAMLATLWKERGVAGGAGGGVRGAFNADPLAVLAREGSLPYTLDDGLAQLGELAAWTSRSFPRAGVNEASGGVRSVRVGTAAYHHAGATATQDLAFSMATALEYLRAMERAGMSVADAARQMVFSYAVGCQVFLAAAKLRAARRLWTRVLEACGVDGRTSGEADAARMVMHARPSKRVFTTRDPWMNLLRNTACVFAAGLGGADAIGSLPMDAAGGGDAVSGAFARRLARNTPMILQEEAKLHAVSDPAGGSYYIERLTEELAERAWVILRAIESRGGMAACVRSGWVAEQIDGAMKPRARNVATRRDVVVGVSEYAEMSVGSGVDNGPVIGVGGDTASGVDGADRATARERVRAVGVARTGAWRAGGRFTGADGAAERGWGGGSESRAGRAAAMVAGGATIGEIARACWAAGDGGRRGESESVTPITLHPFAEPFERLRDAADELSRRCGRRPRVYLVGLGTLAEHTARSTYARGFFAAGGFEVVELEGLGDADGAAAGFEAALARGASGLGDGVIAVICGTDAAYAACVAVLAPRLHRAGAKTVVLAGNPGANEGAYRSAGVDRFIYVRCDAVGVLSEMLREEGAEL